MGDTGDQEVKQIPTETGEQFDAKAAKVKFLDRFRGRGKEKQEPATDSFEAKFQSGIRRYESLGGIIEATTVRPENPKSDVPVVLAPGWSENKKVFKNTIEQLHNAGRIVIALDHPRRGGSVNPMEEYPIDELRKAKTIEAIVEEDGLEKVDIIAHSEGAINGAIFASMKPERVRNMVLVNPAGLIGKDTIPRLVGRFVRKGVENLMHNLGEKSARKAALQGQLETYKYIGQNPRRAFGEVRAISRSEIEDMLRDLDAEGIGIAIMHGVDDPGFPMDRMQKIVKSNAQPEGFVDGFASVTGGHDELSIHPDKYTPGAEALLSALEKKHKEKRPREEKPKKDILVHGPRRLQVPTWGIEHTDTEEGEAKRRTVRPVRPSWSIDKQPVDSI